jgi:TonB family protein
MIQSRAETWWISWVLIAGGVDGTVQSVTTVEGSPLLGEAASSAVRNWTFQPARRDGKPVDDRVRINIEFFLNGEQVRAQVISPAVNPDP